MEALKLINTDSQQTKSLKLLAKVDGLDKRHEHCGFLNFKVSPQNEKQFEICKNWDGMESITLTGRTGTGKTHLAISMLKNMKMQEIPEEKALYKKVGYEYDIKNYPDKSSDIQKYLDAELYKYRPARGLIISVVEMFVRLNEAAMKEGKLSMLDEYAGETYDCICFDDLGAEKLTDAKRENLYYIIDSRYRNMLPTIITTNFTIEEINENEPRIASRLSEMGKILKFSGDDYRLKLKQR